MLVKDMSPEQLIIHRAKRAAYMKEYYQKQHNKCLAQKTKYREANREKLAQAENDRYWANRDEIREKQKEYRNRDIEFTRERNRNYNQSYRDYHREAVRERSRDHAKTQKGRLNAIAAKGARRAREKGTHYERIDWKAVWNRFDGNCHICTKPLILGVHRYQFDHIVPLALKGEHITSNLLPAHSNCNLRKNRKMHI